MKVKEQLENVFRMGAGGREAGPVTRKEPKTPTIVEDQELQDFVKRIEQLLRCAQRLEAHLAGDVKLWEIPAAALVDYASACTHAYVDGKEETMKEQDLNALKQVSETSARLRETLQNLNKVDEERAVILRDLRVSIRVLQDVISCYETWLKDDARLKSLQKTKSMHEKRIALLRDRKTIDNVKSQIRTAETRKNQAVKELEHAKNEANDASLARSMGAALAEYFCMILLLCDSFTTELDPLRPVLEQHMKVTLEQETTKIQQRWKMRSAERAAAQPVMIEEEEAEVAAPPPMPVVEGEELEEKLEMEEEEGIEQQQKEEEWEAEEPLKTPQMQHAFGSPLTQSPEQFQKPVQSRPKHEVASM
mmetsp:Transcript_11434/g.20681  ORF Transcript_11434/g.20681 Transcript_11434/m.20681 type:complete len:363 (-) Transcript_11434:3184-4272(-)